MLITVSKTKPFHSVQRQWNQIGCLFLLRPLFLYPALVKNQSKSEDIAMFRNMLVFIKFKRCQPNAHPPYTDGTPPPL
jgi:hypothetical protein